MRVAEVSDVVGGDESAKRTAEARISEGDPAPNQLLVLISVHARGFAPTTANVLTVVRQTFVSFDADNEPDCGYPGN